MAQYMILAETHLRAASQGAQYACVGPLEEAEAKEQFAQLAAGRGHELWVDRKGGTITREAENRIAVISKSSLTRGLIVDRYTLSEVL